MTDGEGKERQTGRGRNGKERNGGNGKVREMEERLCFAFRFVQRRSFADCRFS